MLFKKHKYDRHVFEEERKLRVKKVARAGGREYYDFLVSLPRPWVERLLRELGLDPKKAKDAEIKLKLIYDGDIVIKPA